MIIVWRDVEGFSNYEVSNTGLVRDTLSGSILRQDPTEGGYFRVWLRQRLRYGSTIALRRRVHLLVLAAFSGPKPSARHVGAHAPDRDKSNNTIDNLRWALPEENEADKKAHGTARNGTPTKLTPRQIKAIRWRIAKSESDTSIAKVFGVHRHTISRIRRGLRHAQTRVTK